MSENVTTNVQHADKVDHADHTEQAGRVQNATSVGTVDHMDLHMDTLGSVKLRRLMVLRDLLLLTLAVGAAIALIIVFLDKQSDQNQFLAQSKANAVAISTLTDEVTQLQGQLGAAKDALEAKNDAQSQLDREDTLANECVDFAQAALAGKTADLVVALATTVPGTTERAEIAAKVVADVAIAKDYVLQVVETRPADCPPYPVGP